MGGVSFFYAIAKHWIPCSQKHDVMKVVETSSRDQTASSTVRKLLWLYSLIGQVKLSVPATELTSVSVQWGAGDPASGTDQNAIPLALSIEASVDGGHEWQGITGGGEAVDVALAHKASLGSSQHRYPVSLLGLRRKR